MPRTVYVVPHTHWDREWYQPHELFRWRLVQMIDELLNLLERDPDFRCFTLDGQTIVIADYLELRPENEARLRALIAAGRITIGPWWVQPDEFLPSGESHIRSLQRGIRWAERLGGSMLVGHCADQFGHIAQMPQIMAGLGLTSACLWRGVPDSVPGWSFWWEAPDGTRLPVLYLRNSYSSGWRLPADPDELITRVRGEEQNRREDEPALLMNGTDHTRVQADLPAVLAAAAERGYELRIAGLHEYAGAMLDAGIDEHVHQGELRSPDNSNVLVGVLSARMNIKQRDFQVTALLERCAEPIELLAHLHTGFDGLPALKHAWRLLLENSPHDSICGCSVDQTHREMLPRYDRAEQLAHQIARESVTALAPRLSVPEGGGLLAFRGVPHAPLVIESWVPGGWDAPALRLPDGRVVAAALGPVEADETLTRAETTPAGAARHIDFMREGRIAQDYVQSTTAEVQQGRLVVETVVGEGVYVVEDEPARRETHRIAREGLVERAEIVVRRGERRRLRAVLPPADSIGLETLLPATGAPPTDIAVTATSIANAFYMVRWRTGGLLVHDKRLGIELDGVNAFVDEGDRGDEYNADILPDALTLPHISELLSVEYDAVRARLTYRTVLRVPEGLNPSRSARPRSRAVLLPIESAITLWTGVPRIEFAVTVENRARDHRLRTLFPLPFTTPEALTENQFHVMERPVEPPLWNGRSAEQPPATFPQKTFVAFEAGGRGVAVFNRGLPEGEVIAHGGGQAYALTLLRCVGWLSRPDLASRRGGAGPTIATAESQMAGRHTFAYALTSYPGSWRESGVQPLAHAFAYPALAYATNAHAGERSGALPLLGLPDAALVPSAAHRSAADGAPVVRFYSVASTPLSARMRAPAALGEARIADLLERPIAEPRRHGDAWETAIRPWQILTLRFESEPPR